MNSTLFGKHIFTKPKISVHTNIEDKEPTIKGKNLIQIDNKYLHLHPTYHINSIWNIKQK